mmetsp:Transcript_14254/g.56111  ORF Transcript_14254/g.56111 Transcript_14254/m.56111 type:complete len:400 (-) Transcript_14254:35-1234(-)
MGKGNGSWNLRDRIHAVLIVYGVVQVLVLMVFYTRITASLPTFAEHRAEVRGMNIHHSAHRHGADEYDEDQQMQAFLRMRGERLDRDVRRVDEANGGLLPLEYACNSGEVPTSKGAVEVSVHVGVGKTGQPMTVDFFLATHGVEDQASRALVNPEAWRAPRLAIMYKAIMRAKREGRRVVLLHVGAGMGLHTAFFASVGADVVAFEPFRHHMRKSCLTTRLNRQTQRVTLVNAAVSDASGFGTWCADRSNTAWTSRHDCPKVGDEGYSARVVESITATTLDDYLAANLPELLPLQRSSPAGDEQLEIMLLVSASGDEEFVLAGGVTLLEQANVRHLWVESSMRNWAEHDVEAWAGRMSSTGWKYHSDDCSESMRPEDVRYAKSSSHYFTKRDDACDVLL